MGAAAQIESLEPVQILQNAFHPIRLEKLGPKDIKIAHFFAPRRAGLVSAAAATTVRNDQTFGAPLYSDALRLSPPRSTHYDFRPTRSSCLVLGILASRKPAYPTSF
jgi:hypothetical protein